MLVILFIRWTKLRQPMKSILKKMQIHIIPGFSDNYTYLIIDQKTKEAAIVDPADYTKVLPALEKLSKTSNFNLTKILTTHKHWVRKIENSTLGPCRWKLKNFGSLSKT
jgi:glyoxylase-like metal-dependent hydrolase (beta-lactamase superfamily II)